MAALGSRENDSRLAAQFHRLARHMLKKKAILGVAHSILVIAYYVLKGHKPYQDLGRDYFLKQNKQNKDAVQKRCIRQLERLGFKVSVEALPAEESHSESVGRASSAASAESPNLSNNESPMLEEMEVRAQPEVANGGKSQAKSRTGRGRACQKAPVQPSKNETPEQA